MNHIYEVLGALIGLLFVMAIKIGGHISDINDRMREHFPTKRERERDYRKAQEL